MKLINKERFALGLFLFSLSIVTVASYNQTPSVGIINQIVNLIALGVGCFAMVYSVDFEETKKCDIRLVDGVVVYGHYLGESYKNGEIINIELKEIAKAVTLAQKKKKEWSKK